MLKITDIMIDSQSFDHIENHSSCCASDSPLIAWAADSDIPYSIQSAYRLTVAQNDKVLLDSGWSDSSEQQVYYDGLPLCNGVFDVTIAIRSDKGEESEPRSLHFTYGKIDGWDADWIAASEDTPRHAIRFATRANIKSGFVNVTAYVCGLGYHELHINGQNMSRSVMSPAHSNYKKTAYYEVIPNLTFHDGDNLIEILVGDGWRRSQSNFIKANTQGRTIEFFGQPMLTAIFEVTYSDGRVERIRTGADWTWTYDKIVMNDIYDGETYNANFADDCPKSVVIAEKPCERLLAQTIQPIHSRGSYPTRTVYSPKEGVYVFDFGQNIAGVPYVTLPEKMTKGQEIKIICHEILDEDGTLYTPTLREAKCTDTYIASGDENDLRRWMPKFTYHGFRYAQVTGWTGVPDADSIIAVARHTDIENGSFFECGSALLNKIQLNVVQTEKANLHSILTDCPQRDERMGWLNDATVRFTETPYNFNIGRLFPKVVRDVLDGQREDGSIQCTAPYVFGGNPADPVCSSFLVAGMEAYRATGDIRVLEEGYGGWCAWENKLLSCKNEDEPYIVNYSYYGDWAGPAYACITPEHAVSAVTPGIFMSTGFSYYNCRLLEFFADRLGKAEDSARWGETAEYVKAALLKKWWDGDRAVMATGSQACQAFALWLGVIPSDRAQAAAQVMRDDLVNGGYRMTTGNLCTLYMLEMLTKYGYIDEAYTLMTREEYPSYGFMIQNEATTIWERFELKKDPGMNSYDHPMFGSVGRWFYTGLCGLTISASEQSKAIINLPKLPEKLLSAQCRMDTRFGAVCVRWVKRFGKACLYLTIPFGMSADITFGESTCVKSSGWHTFEAAL